MVLLQEAPSFIFPGMKPSFHILFLETHTSHHSHRHWDAVYSSGGPAGHQTKDAQSLFIEQGVDTAQKAYVAYMAVRVDDKPAGHSSLYPFVVCFLGVDTGGVYKFSEFAFPSGETGFLGYIVVLVGFYISCEAFFVNAYIDSNRLCSGVGC